MLLDLSKSLNYLYYFIMAIMSTNFAFFLLEQTDNGNIVIYEPDAVVYHEHGLNQGTSFGRAKRVCNALSNLHEDDIFEWPSFET